MTSLYVLGEIYYACIDGELTNERDAIMPSLLFKDEQAAFQAAADLTLQKLLDGLELHLYGDSSSALFIDAQEVANLVRPYDDVLADIIADENSYDLSGLSGVLNQMNDDHIGRLMDQIIPQFYQVYELEQGD